MDPTRTRQTREAAAGSESENPPGPNATPASRTSFITAGLFNAADADKDGSLTRAELMSTFDKWFADWDSDKSGALTEEKLYAGLSAALPRQGGFGGQGGPGGGQGGRGGFGGGSGPPKALTAAQVGLIRAWIDQGAK